AGKPSRIQSRLGPDRRITPADLLEAKTVAHQCLDAARIEQLAALLPQPAQGLFQRPGGLVRPCGQQRVQDIRDRHDPGLDRNLIALETIGVAATVVALVVAQGDGGPHLHEPDRKSTRLNSSHVKISYAVFCLKKKNRTN